MIAVAEKQHAIEFRTSFDQLFIELARFARSHGIDGCYKCGGNSSGEDPEDFAQECLIEYSNRARRGGFSDVQHRLINRIAHNRLVDAWRKRDRRPHRKEFEPLANELTEFTGSGGDEHGLSAIPELQCLSEKAVEILRLKHVAKWLDREIADALGMTVDGVRSSLKRSQQRLLTKRGNAEN